MVKEMVEGEWSTAARFGRCLATVRTASGGAPTSRSSSTALPCSPQAPPWVNSFGHWWIELVWRLSLCARVWGLRDKIWWIQAAIYGASWSFSKRRRSPTFCIYKLNSNSASFGRFLEGGELRVGYDMETEFSTGLTWVKAKTLSGIGLGSRVRSGPGRVTGLGHFLYQGAI
jgi:hypothetical protein